MTAEAGPAEHSKEHPGELRVSTLELFFDLVFVFTLTQLTVLLAHHLTWTSAGRVLLIFIVLFWMYGAYAHLTNQVPPDRPARRLLLIAGMASFLLCALAIPGAFGDDGVAFGIGYLLVVLVHGALFIQANGWQTLWFAAPNALGAALIIAAGATDGTVADVLWIAAIALQLLTSRLVLRRADETTRAEEQRLGGVRSDHFVERHGLLLIVAFGESVIAIGVGLEELPLDAGTITATLLGLALAAGLWWAYFVRDEDAAEERLAAAGPQERFRLSINAYFYSFIPMLLGIVCLAAGVKKSLGHLFEHLHTGPAVALAGGVALYLAGDAAFRTVLGIRPRAGRAAAAAVALATVPLGTQVNAAVQLIALVAVIVALLAIEYRLAPCPTSEAPEATEEPGTSEATETPEPPTTPKA
ncbi:low temperature requirement protein A [Streptomyces sp. A7024]|uniref:Low temperature requirement protein A n=1 Tax=Streptomyces coryli TaxID=1128680 RepID=A0A6G4UB88_9ACTN|nr:low temperature requirement protein A [Streptomyces coryli]NGN69489.1 low temperature requirement protein A [Streptomyces coryli]